MKKRYLIVSVFSLFIGLAFIVQSCASDSKTSDNIESKDKKEEVVKNLKKVMIALPSPVETSLLLKKAGAGYNQNLLNPTTNSSKYNIDKSRALNLGVYGADLSYASIFNQDQTIMKYMHISKKLATDLGLLESIDPSIIERLESNHGNRDSIIFIISETFMNTNSQLKDDNRPEIAALVLAGGWIEGLYLATNLVSKIEKKDLVERIVEQKLSLNELVQLLESHKTNADIASVLVEVLKIKKAFEGIEIIKSDKIEVVTNLENKQTEFKGSQKIKITQSQYDNLKTVVGDVRKTIVQ